jgi:serralysin
VQARGTGTARGVVTDYLRGTGVLDLGGIDANTAVAGNQAFAFLGSALFTGTFTLAASDFIL